MAALRLRTQLLIASLLMICALTGALILLVRHTVRLEVTQGVQDGTNASLKGFETVQSKRELDLSRIAAMLAELPPLKNAMITEDAPTIQDASVPFWKLAGSDLFLLASPEGRVLGLHVQKTGMSFAVAEADLKRSLDQRESSGWWYVEGQLYWVFLRPITIGNDERRIGTLAVGYQIDSKIAQELALLAGSQVVLATGNNVIASTIPANEETDLQKWVALQKTEPKSEAREIVLGSEPYEVASVQVHSGPPAAVQCYVLMSLESANDFIQKLNRSILILAVTAVIFAALLLSFVSRTITRPLENLVAGVRALAGGDYTYSITPRGSSEVAELGEAFAKMRGELLASQERWIAAERIAALGRAASSISHDLRHYLAAVVANAEFLYEADTLGLSKDEVYEEIKTASVQMTDLLDSLRELARGDSRISPVPASLDQTARRAVEAVLARPELRNRQIAIRPSGEMEGVFDPRKIERALFNLILNACEATAQWQGNISIELFSAGDTFEVRVIDNGPGIPAGIREVLFDPFVSSGKPNGTGLGLAIVNKIINDHGGSVTVERTSEVGTVFLIRLPRASRVLDEAPQVAGR